MSSNIAQTRVGAPRFRHPETFNEIERSAMGSESPIPAVRIVVAGNYAEPRGRPFEQLNVAPDLEVVGEARDGREAIAAVGRLAPDVLALEMDLAGMSGLEVLPVVKWLSPKTKVIILSGQGEETTILEALKQGARGYIVKGDETDLGKAIRAVQRGEVWAKRRVLARLMEELIGLATLPPPSTADKLSLP
jgi:DNA-binding NarL/FixJ family response regulator